jgi:hypothetical protein
MTPFQQIYDRFFGKITDDMYMELTPQDTLRDLQGLLIDAIPGFEFPRKPISDYTISTKVVREDEVTEDDFIIGVIWNHVPEDIDVQIPEVLIECSEFNCEPLTSEEINILALLMKQGWVQRQVTSIENTRMKYSGSDFKFTSQANHLAKLLSLLEETRRDSFHMQRLYKRRKLEDGQYQSNWSVLLENSALK